MSRERTSDTQREHQEGGERGKEAEAERGRGQRPAGRRAEGEAEEAQEEGGTEVHKNWAGGKSKAIELRSHVQGLELFSVWVRRTKVSGRR